jgi:5S rRNA maturation endonuclease (ribonuclease M5)
MTQLKKTKKKEKQSNPYFDMGVLNEITEMGCDNIDNILVELGVDYKRYGKMMVGCCPVHGGDNESAWNFYPNGIEVRGYWKCRTKHCERQWKPTFLGFVRGVLNQESKEPVSWVDTVKWVLKQIGYDNIEDVPKPDEETMKKKAYARAINKLSLKPTVKKFGWKREAVRSFLKIPAEYYLNRGYTEEILDKYDVGYYDKKHRIAVPVYDNSYKECVGFTCRSLFERCAKCKFYHNPASKCPEDKSEKRYASKWLNSEGFESKNHLYNYWFAKDAIADSGVAILVEGPGDTWKFEQNGINISLGMFGTELSDEQSIILERSGAMSVIIMTDPDKAGEEAAQKLKKQLGRTYRTYFPTFSHTEDVGDLQDDAVTDDIKPYIDNIMRLSA